MGIPITVKALVGPEELMLLVVGTLHSQAAVMGHWDGTTMEVMWARLMEPMISGHSCI